MINLSRTYRRFKAEVFSLFCMIFYFKKRVLFYTPIIIINPSKFSFGMNFRILERGRLEAYAKHNSNNFSPKVKFGDNVSINYDFHLGCINEISIGNNVLIASNVTIIDHNHGDTDYNSLQRPPSERELISKGPIIIEDNVWICQNAIILPNTSIGKNSIISAGSIVKGNIPSNSIYFNDKIIQK